MWNRASAAEGIKMTKVHKLGALMLSVGTIAVATAGWTQQQTPAPGRAGAPAPGRAAAEPVNPPGTPSSTIRVKLGQVRGAERAGVETFLGIPFAAPPTGDRRWRPPAAAAAWAGVRDGSKAGGSCADVEDCLYLNVHRPASARAGDKLPVMVWIHGGSFTSGSGAGYNGTEFAEKGVVVVTVNYRLGRAGWFAHPALTREGDTGNYGIMDQIAALKWVRDNVGAFGGDANNVTIFGESAGAISVNYLVLSPQARGLFHKAISQSGFGRHQPRTLQQQEAAGIALAAKAGVSDTGPEAIAALRKLPISAIPGSGGYSDLDRPHPIIDGKYITHPLADGFAKGQQAKIPLMIGGNSNEASLYRPDGSQLPAVTSKRAAMLAAFDPQRTNDARRIVNDLVTVERITEPDRNLARLQAKAGQPTYLYYFSYLPALQRATSLGAAHAGELRYVFGNLGANAAADDLSIHQSMNAYWTAFAKYGNPGAAGGPTWPRYDLTREPSMEFAMDGPHVREKFQAAKLDYVEQAWSGQACAVSAFPVMRC